MKDKFLSTIFLFSIFFIFSSNLNSASKFIITGVAPAQTNGEDWVEIFLLERATFDEIRNLRLKITHYNTSKEFFFSDIIPSQEMILEKNKFIIVYINKSTNTFFYDYNNNIVIFTTFTMTNYGMYSSDAIVALKNSTTSYLDVLCFTDKDGSTGTTIVNEFNTIVSIGQWSPGGAYDQTTCVASDKVDKNNEIFARIKGGNGLPIDTNTKDDWQYAVKETPGWGYKEITETTQKYLEVDKNTNPFCPEDSQNSFVAILFNIPDISAKKTITIFDIKGKEIIKLLDNDIPQNQTSTTYTGITSGSVVWDGMDKYGNRVPTGVYIVYLDAYNSSTGQRYLSKDVVVVGRKF